ncbi:MAG TPA: ADOP family duplicated permease, partial [Candidatus Dormibacteraeota bacterium]|nr:ADOP family duplicated permease [Candidatus Dormibacteraeota bacterium]
MAALITDLTYALRLMRKSPGFTSLAILSLAVGIAANVVIFSIVNGVLLRPLAFSHPENLYTIEEIIPKVAHLYPTLPVNPRHAAEWKKTVPGIEQMGLMQSGSATLGGAQTTLVASARVTPDFLQTLGVKPIVGRLIDSTDAQQGHDRVVLLTYELWKTRFGGIPNIVGRQIPIGGVPYNVIGVMPASFHCPQLGPEFSKQPAQLLTPLVLNLLRTSLMGNFNYGAVVRLKSGTDPKIVLADLNVEQTAIARTFPEKLEIRAVLAPLRSYIVKDSRRALIVLLCAVLAVLLVVCLNLAVLLLARANLRNQEMAVRAAIGASRWRLFRQSLTESLLYAVLGGAAGTWLAVVGFKWVLNAVPQNLPRAADAQIDNGVLVFALGVTILTAFVFGLYPALQQSRRNPQATLGATSRSSTASRKSAGARVLLIAFEVGLSTMLLIVAGLFMNSFVRLLDVNTGFQARHGVSAQINLPGANYKSDGSVQLFYEKLLNSIEHRPGIAEAGLISQLPLEGEMWNDDLSRPGDPRPVSSRPWTNVRFIGGSYFAAMGVPLLEGRTFRNRTGERKDVVVVSDSVAKQLWPKESPVSQPVILNGQSFTVIGVAGDTRAEMDKVAPLMVYVPYWASNIGSVSQYNVILSTTLPPHDAITLLRQTVSSLDHGVAISKVRSFDEIVADSVAPRRFQLTLVSLFAVAALLVAALGIFGIVAGLVAARRSEIGIRMAL